MSKKIKFTLAPGQDDKYAIVQVWGAKKSNPLLFRFVREPSAPEDPEPPIESITISVRMLFGDPAPTDTYLYFITPEAIDHRDAMLGAGSGVNAMESHLAPSDTGSGFFIAEQVLINSAVFGWGGSGAILDHNGLNVSDFYVVAVKANGSIVQQYINASQIYDGANITIE